MRADQGLEVVDAQVGVSTHPDGSLGSEEPGARTVGVRVGTDSVYGGIGRRLRRIRYLMANGFGLGRIGEIPTPDRSGCLLGGFGRVGGYGGWYALG